MGVMDLERSYIGPAQLFGSALWWLLQDRPIVAGWEAAQARRAVLYIPRYLQARPRGRTGEHAWLREEGTLQSRQMIAGIGGHVAQKTLRLKEYDVAKDILECDKTLVDDGQMT